MGRLLCIVCLCLMLAGSALAQTPEVNECAVSAPPVELNLDPFYAKYCDVEGIPILSSTDVPDEALEQAWVIAYHLLQGHPDLSSTMQDYDVKIGIIGAEEFTTDLPDYQDLNELFPETDWDTRTRGIGATITIPMVSGAEENLLCYVADPYHGESIFLHEFSHTVKEMGMHYIDPTFESAILAAYNTALAEGKWQNTYADDTVEEYWAEGVQDYFDANLQADPSDGIHNAVNTREELASYDPALFDLIDSLYHDVDWLPSCPENEDETSSGGSASTCSESGSTLTEITFQNLLSETVDVYWVDYNCEEVFYFSLAPNQTYIQSTYETHVWAVRDSNNNLVAEFVGQATPSSMVIQ